jgi:hypothetical protein
MWTTPYPDPPQMLFSRIEVPTASSHYGGCAPTFNAGIWGGCLHDMEGSGARGRKGEMAMLASLLSDGRP